MIKLVLGNSDYKNHMTDEGHQLEAGLKHAGWIIAGYQQEIDETDVPTIINKVQPDIVFIQDPRDWDSNSNGCFNPLVSFRRIISLANLNHIFKIVSFKDAGSGVGYQQDFAASVGTHALSCYYHDLSILPLSPWARNYIRFRTYHTVDRYLFGQFQFGHNRRRGVVTGVYSSGEVYPVRKKIFESTETLDISRLQHPGYHNRGTTTPEFLKTLNNFKVSIATASQYKFAVRKIIESVCSGCICITNLPAYDRLPIIDDWLIRFNDTIDILDFKRLIDRMESQWDVEVAYDRATIARGTYDYRIIGAKLDADIQRGFQVWANH